MRLVERSVVLNSLGVEDDRLVGTAIADVSFAEFAEDCNAVYPLEVGDAADLGSAVGIDNSNFGVVRNVEATRGGIKSDVVPIFLAAWWSA